MPFVQRHCRHKGRWDNKQLGDLEMPTNRQMRSPKGVASNGSDPDARFDQGSWLGNQLASAGGGLFDGATFGLGDKAYAGLGALTDAIHGVPLGEAYDKRIAYERARDDYNARKYGAARMAGEIGSAFLPIPGVGLAGAAAKAIGRTSRFAEFGKVLKEANQIGTRIKQVTPMIGRERAFVGALGGGGGLAGQAYSDAMTGHLGSFGDYAGSIAGGVAQSQMALRMKPKWAGAGGGAATSALKDIFNGRPISVTNAAEDAAVGHLSGAAGDMMGRVRFNRRGIAAPPSYAKTRGGATPKPGSRITRREKEQMGETFSRARTVARGDRTLSTEKKALKLDAGGYTIPDQLTAALQYVESKAGNWARLRARQLQASLQAGLNYRIDHLLPKDLGSALGFMTSQAANRFKDHAEQDTDLPPHY